MFLLIGCAGPSSPFGANILFSSEYVETSNYTTFNESHYTEGMLKLLDKGSQYDLKLKIQSDHNISKSFRYEIIYNNKKLKRWWKTEEITFSNDKKSIFINFKSISFPKNSDNSFLVKFYPTKNSGAIVHKVHLSICDHNQKSSLSEINNQKNNIDNEIVFLSDKYDINPYLLLTLINENSVSKKENYETEASKLKQLIKFWNSYDNKILLEGSFKSIPMTDIIIASYDTDANTIKEIIKKYSSRWLNSQELSSTKKFVNDIKHDCLYNEKMEKL
jgi:hypothetical protein